MLGQKTLCVLLMSVGIGLINGCGIQRSTQVRAEVLQTISTQPGCHVFITFHNGRIHKANVVAHNRLFVLTAILADGSLLFSTSDEPFELLICVYYQGTIACAFGE